MTTIDSSKIVISKNITIKNHYFIVEKTSDVFKEVVFKYSEFTWYGVLPKTLEKQGLELSEIDFLAAINDQYEMLNPVNKQKWINESDATWEDKNSATYKVLKALYSGAWECRVCGPVPKVNPQPAARLASLKKRGYIIGSKRRDCLVCKQKTMNDILVMLPKTNDRLITGNELRKPISKSMALRIKSTLGRVEACFNANRSDVELLIDHKFPSQRWNKLEIDNNEQMSEIAIREKFQLLSNQTNMWKSRQCDHCVKNSHRGNFFGIVWYYAGNSKWQGVDKYDESGCIGCPWYDLEKWKHELNITIKSLVND